MQGYITVIQKLISSTPSPNTDGAYAEVRRGAAEAERTYSLSVANPALSEYVDLYIDKKNGEHPVVRYQNLNSAGETQTRFLELYNGTTNKQKLIDLMHPVGSCMTMSTNTNPSTKLGGTWTLIDKHMKAQYLDSGIFTANSSACSVSSQAASIYGHNISLRIAVKYTGSGTSDTDTIMGNVKFSAIGLSRFPNSRYYNNGYNESTNASIAYSVGWEDGEIRYRYGEIATDNTIYFDFIVVITNIEHITDSFCDRFIWKRTA